MSFGLHALRALQTITGAANVFTALGVIWSFCVTAHVVLIDGDVVDRLATRRATVNVLEAEGLSSGLALLQQLARDGELEVLVLCDLRLPFDSGRRTEGENSKTRITSYLPAALYPTVSAAAWAVRLTLPKFCIGSTLRQIALAKLINERRLSSNESAEMQKHKPELAAIVVPYYFDDLVRSTRH